MADNKKYYYMRLKENFFDSSELVAMESLPDGFKYSNILLKMYLRSLRDEGRLMIGTIPYSPEMIASITKQDVDTVNEALELFQDFGLIDILDSGAIYMLDIQNYIGKSSTEADRQREYQTRINREKDKCPGKFCKKSNKKSTPEIELETETNPEYEGIMNDSENKREFVTEFETESEDKREERDRRDYARAPSTPVLIECDDIEPEEEREREQMKRQAITKLQKHIQEEANV
ncbi:MAG: phage replisome organizer N-terminal domain-containing protein [Oscillospiraceae bacterium]